MLRASILFFVLALASMALGIGGVAGISMEIGRLLLGVFLVLAVISLVVGLVTNREPRA